MMFSRFTQCDSVYQYFISLYCWIIFSLYRYIHTMFCLSIPQLMHIWNASTFWLLTNNAAVNIHVQIFVWTFSFSWVYTWKCWVMITVFIGNFHTVFSSGPTILHFTLFSTVAIPFYIPASKVWGYQFLHIFNNTCCFLFIYFIIFIVAIPLGMKCYLIVILSCIALLVSNVEHLFMYLVVICIPSLEMCLFKSFAHIKIGLFFFALLSCKFFIYS